MPEKNSGLNGIRTHDLCDTCAVLYQLSYQANWELITLWVRNLPDIFCSGFNFTTAYILFLFLFCLGGMGCVWPVRILQALKPGNSTSLSVNQCAWQVWIVECKRGFQRSQIARKNKSWGTTFVLVTQLCSFSLHCALLRHVGKSLLLRSKDKQQLLYKLTRCNANRQQITPTCVCTCHVHCLSVCATSWVICSGLAKLYERFMLESFIKRSCYFSMPRSYLLLSGICANFTGNVAP